MSRLRASPVGDTSEEGRAFLQTRVALFWKVLFFITLLSCGLGAVGAVAKPGVDFVVVVALTAQAGIFWWLCRHGQRSIRFSRAMEAGGLLFNLVGGAFLGRYFFAAFARDHSLATAEGALMGDAYVSMLQQGGTAMMVSIRAALIPSSPRRTIVVTALVGAHARGQCDRGADRNRWARLAPLRLGRVPLDARWRCHDVGFRHHHGHGHLVGHLWAKG